MEPRADVLIVGGGVIGLTSAYFLAKAGRQVTVVDKQGLAQEASWAGAGILPPGEPTLPQAPASWLRSQGSKLYPSLSAELRELTGLDNGYWPCGGLEVPDPDAVGSDEWAGPGAQVVPLTQPELSQQEPRLANAVSLAHHLPGLAQIRNPRHLKALLAGCTKLGVTFLPGLPIHRFETQDARVLAVGHPEGRIWVEQVLLTAGAWTQSLLAPLGWQPRIVPVRGQIVLLQTVGTPLKHVLLQGARYIVPRTDGRVLVGSTEEHVGFDKQPTAGGVQGLLTFAHQLAPSLAEAHLERSWAGLRPGSADGLPYLGPVPGYRNLFVAAGHFRAGLQMAPATALVLQQLLLNQPLSLDLTPFRLERTAG